MTSAIIKFSFIVLSLTIYSVLVVYHILYSFRKIWWSWIKHSFQIGVDQMQLPFQKCLITIATSLGWTICHSQLFIEMSHASCLYQMFSKWRYPCTWEQLEKYKLTVFSSIPSLTFVHMTLTFTKVILNTISLSPHNVLVESHIWSCLSKYFLSWAGDLNIWTWLQ